MICDNKEALFASSEDNVILFAGVSTDSSVM